MKLNGLNCCFIILCLPGMSHAKLPERQMVVYIQCVVPPAFSAVLRLTCYHPRPLRARAQQWEPRYREPQRKYSQRSQPVETTHLFKNKNYSRNKIKKYFPNCALEEVFCLLDLQSKINDQLDSFSLSLLVIYSYVFLISSSGFSPDISVHDSRKAFVQRDRAPSRADQHCVRGQEPGQREERLQPHGRVQHGFPPEMIVHLENGKSSCKN